MAAGDVSSTLRILADASQAINTLRTLASELKTVNTVVADVNKQSIAATIPGINTAGGNLGQGVARTQPRLTSTTTSIDTLNNVFKQAYRIDFTGPNGEALTATINKVTGNVDQAVAAVERLNRLQSSFQQGLSSEQRDLIANRTFTENLTAAQTAGLAVEQQYSGIIQSQIDKIGALKGVYSGYVDTLKQEQVQLKSNLEVYKAQQAELAATPNFAQSSTRRNAYSVLDQKIADTNAQIARNRGLIAYNSGLAPANDPTIKAAEAELANIRGIVVQAQQTASEAVQAAENAIKQGVSAAAALPRNLQLIAKESPQLFNKLAAQGFSTNGQLDVNKAYNDTNISVTRDLERQVTTVNGTLRDQEGILTRVHAQYGAGGRVITRYGGILSGLHNTISQIGRDFVKVAEYLTATTVVFAGIGLAAQSFSTLTQLNKLLTQFGITAQISGAQTTKLFNQLADVAYQTATPLKELVSAADDIALSTRKAGQSTADWQANILTLGKAVGILTNIAGIDTVTATDALTSIMKQLNLQSTDLIGVLNKITAVAGGQQNSIKDIVTGLGAMAEAAKQANLSIDQSIGTLQTLSQVTNKSASEVAVSFKNLVGSLYSPGSIKVLDSYNISLKDQQGNLRNILDIYGEINQKIQEGIIKQGDVEHVLRGISGGPRRLPDAAALLSNVTQIDAAVQKSQSATNEALTTNAKYLDTVSAKITQFQVRFEQFLQNTFGPAFANAVSTITGLLGGLIGVLDKLGPQFINTVLAVSEFVIVFKLLQVGAGVINGVFKDITATFQKVNYAAQQTGRSVGLLSQQQTESAAAVAAANQKVISQLDTEIITYNAKAEAAKKATLTTQEMAYREAANISTAAKQEIESIQAVNEARAAGSGGILGTGLSRKGALGIGVGALAGGGIAAATGGSPGQIAGGLLQGAGFAALAIPGVGTPWAVAGIAIGTLLQLATANDKVTDSFHKSDQQLLQAVQDYKEARSTIASLTQQQNDSEATINALSGTYEDAAKNANILNAALQQYGSTLNQIDEAQKKAADSAKILHDNQFLVGSLDKNIAGSNVLTSSGRDAQTELLNKILSAQIGSGYQPITRYESPPGAIFDFNRPGPAQTLIRPLSSVPQIPYSGSIQATSRIGDKFDLNNFTSAEQILSLFNKDFTNIYGGFAITSENLQTVHDRLVDISQGTGEVSDNAKKALVTFNAWASSFNVLANSDAFTKQQAAILQTGLALGQLTDAQVNEGNKNLDLFNQYTQAATQAKTPKEFDQILAERNKFLVNNQGNIVTTPFSVSQTRQILTDLKDTKKITLDINTLSDTQIATLGNSLGIYTAVTAEQQKQLGNLQQEQTVLDNLNALQQSSLDAFAQRNLQIEQSFEKGDITAAQRTSLQAASQATQDFNQKLTDLFTNLDSESLTRFETSLSKLPGLETLSGQSADNAAKSIQDWLGKLDLSTPSGQNLAKSFLQYLGGIEKLPQVGVRPTNLLNASPGLRGETSGLSSAQRAELSGQQQINSALDDTNNLSVEQLKLVLNTKLALDAQNAARQAALTIENNLNALSKQSLDSQAQRNLDIQKQFLSGSITAKQRDTLLAASSATKELDDSIVKLFKDFSNGSPALSSLEQHLSKIPGLENLVGQNADVAAKLLFAWIDSMGLTGKAADSVKEKILQLLVAQEAIANAPPAKLIVDVETRLYTSSTPAGRAAAADIAQEHSNDNSLTKAGKSASSLSSQIEAIINSINKSFSKISGGSGSTIGTSKSGGGAGSGLNVSTLDIPTEVAQSTNEKQLLAQAVLNAKRLQSEIPGANAQAKNDVVELLNGTKRVLEVRGVKEDLLRKALDELAKVEQARLNFDTKANTIQRIRIGEGSFAGLANVPFNATTGVSTSGPNGPISINLNINGQVLTPAQFDELANKIGSAIKRQIGA